MNHPDYDISYYKPTNYNAEARQVTEITVEYFRGIFPEINVGDWFVTLPLAKDLYFTDLEFKLLFKLP